MASIWRVSSSSIASAELPMAWASAIMPGTPQLPPRSHGRAPGGLLRPAATRPATAKDGLSTTPVPMRKNCGSWARTGAAVSNAAVTKAPAHKATWMPGLRTRDIRPRLTPPAERSLDLADDIHPMDVGSSSRDQRRRALRATDFSLSLSGNYAPDTLNTRRARGESAPTITLETH